MDYNRLAELLFPHINTTPEEMEARYPKRELPEGAKVTRMGPSPTGFMHLGNLYGALVDERLAHQSKGVFYLRIEDTDRKREVEGGVQMIIDAFKSFGLPFDEGATTDGETGIYGPYRQSQRAEIYQTFVKSLVQRGMAYPCFCTEEELAAAHAAQEASLPRARRMLFASARRAALSTRSATRISSRARWKSPRTIRTWLSSSPTASRPTTLRTLWTII